MSRSKQRLCLQDGISLNLNRLLQRGQLKRDGLTEGSFIQWTSSYWGRVGAGTMTADMRESVQGQRHGQFTIHMIGAKPQHIHLLAKPRHYDGHQWYFVCPLTGRLASVLWRVNGGRQFYSRQAYGRQVGYRSQFLDRDNRAHHGQAKIRNRLCDVGKFDPDEWTLPPKPKWMRRKTYERIEALFDHYEDELNVGLVDAAERLMAASVSQQISNPLKG